MLSVVIPSYNEEAMIPRTHQVIGGILREAAISYELIFVNDGSKDRTWEEIGAAASADAHVRGVCFSRNFGKEAAIFAGLSAAKGDCVAVIDCDLQHPPETLVTMYRLWEQGYEVVEGVKASRGEESAAHGFAAKMFYKLMNAATGFDMSRASDFKLLDRKAVTVLLNMPEKNAFFRALSSWIGFKTTEVAYDVREREAGESKWSTRSLIRYALTNITSFSTAPMQIVTFLGCLLLAVSLVFSVIAIIQKVAGVSLGGFTTVILLMCLFASVIMISLGIIGFYIAKMYDEIKGRPRYIVSSTVGEPERPAN